MEKIKLFINDILKIKLVKDLIPFIFIGFIGIILYVSVYITTDYYRFYSSDIRHTFVSILTFIPNVIIETKTLSLIALIYLNFLIAKYIFYGIILLFISKSKKKKGN